MESLAKEANNPKTARWMRNTFPQSYTINDAKRWISISRSVSPVHDFAICQLDSVAVIGGVGLKTGGDIHYRTVEIGYWLGEDHWHQGIATGVVSAFSNWTFEHFENIVRLEAEVFEGNAASFRVLGEAGFVYEARHRKAIEKSGVVMDVLVYCSPGRHSKDCIVFNDRLFLYRSVTHYRIIALSWPFIVHA